MAFGDFVALKRRLSIEQTAVLLGLNTKPTGRPVQTARKAASVRSSSRWRKELFYCFPGKKGGDAIELVCHVKGVSQKDGAALMSGESPMTPYAFFTDGICPQQFEKPPSLTDERTCDTAQLYRSPRGAFSLDGCAYGPSCRIKTNSKRTLFSQHTAQLK